MSAIRVIAATALSLSCATACMAPEPPPEPFNTSPYGPGLEVDLPGDKVQLTGSDGSARYNLRIGSSALRIYDDVGIRIGSAAVVSGQLEVSRRDGSEVCTVLEQQANAVVVECGQNVTVSAALEGDTWTLSDESGSNFSLSMTGEAFLWSSTELSVAVAIETQDDSVTLTIGDETTAEMSGMSRRPAKERALLLAAGNALTESASEVEAIAWFSAAWIVAQSSADAATSEP